MLKQSPSYSRPRVASAFTYAGPTNATVRDVTAWAERNDAASTLVISAVTGVGLDELRRLLRRFQEQARAADLEALENEAPPRTLDLPDPLDQPDDPDQPDGPGDRPPNS